MEAEALVNRAEQFVHKNRLQEYAQRAAIPLPVYQTINEGSQHAPQFRSTVLIDGETFTSPVTFTTHRAAEQYVAKIAFEGISKKIKNERIPLLRNHTTFCKSILHEYADKMKLGLPTYTNSQLGGLLPMFVTTVVFDGETYVGDPGRSKKEAEQIAARTVIKWILGHSKARTIMCEIIKSKGKLYDAVEKSTDTIFRQDRNVSLIMPIENNSAVPVVQASLTNDKLPAETPKEGNICKLCSVSIGSGRILPALSQNNPPEGSTSRVVNSVSVESHPGQSIRVKVEIPSLDPPILQNDSQSMCPGSLPCNKEKAGGSKKARTNEYLPP